MIRELAIREGRKKISSASLFRLCHDNSDVRLIRPGAKNIANRLIFQILIHTFANDRSSFALSREGCPGRGKFQTGPREGCPRRGKSQTGPREGCPRRGKSQTDPREGCPKRGKSQAGPREGCPKWGKSQAGPRLP